MSATKRFLVLEQNVDIEYKLDPELPMGYTKNPSAHRHMKLLPIPDDFVPPKTAQVVEITWPNEDSK